MAQQVVLLLSTFAVVTALPLQTPRPSYNVTANLANASLFTEAMFASSSGSVYMDCGTGVPLCGVLTLESGYGSGKYSHSSPVVHGLWPQVDNYGSSKCIAPQDTTPPQSLFACYDDLGFMQHEWGAHGKCAGAESARDFFNTICKLASAPLDLMSQHHANGGDISSMANALKASGYPVYHIDTSANSQVELSACADASGKWQIADVASFSSVCGGGGTPPSPSPGPDPSPSPGPGPSPSPSHQGSCIPGKHGPSCEDDSDCSMDGCVRCASSGFCTATPRA